MLKDKNSLVEFFPLILIFLLALFLRSLFVFTNSISFHYDMGRDAFAAQEIWKEYHLKILGPPTSIPGLFHGVFYYYLIAPFYLIGKGNPQFPSFFLSLISSLTLFPLYSLSLRIFKEKKWALLSCLFFAVSFEAVQYGPWLSNPGPALLTLCLYFLGLKLWQEKKGYGLALAVLSAAISTQFQLFFAYLFFILPIFQYLFKTKAARRQLLMSIALGLLGVSTIIFSIFKFNTFKRALEGIALISGSQQLISDKLFSDLIAKYINHIASLFTNNFFPTNLFIGGILGILTFYLCRKNLFIFFALFSSIPVFIFGGHSSNYDNLGILVPAILGMTLLTKTVFSKDFRMCLILILVVIFVNFFSIYKILPNGQVSLVIPTGMVLSKQLKLIDKTYQIASGRHFSINSLTLPSWTNTTWSYLYSWYGKEKYGYMPSFYGRDQTGMPGGNFLVQSGPSETSFFILEPINGIPPYIYSKEIETENSKTYSANEFKYGDLILQQRVPLKKSYE